MTTLSKTITAVVFSAMVLTIAFILSLQSSVYAGGYSEQVTIAQVGSRTIDPNGNIEYAGISEDRYAVIPLSLPPTSGEIDTTQAFGIIIMDTVNSFFASLFN